MNTYTRGRTGITGVAPIFELHYNRSLEDAPSTQMSGSSFSSPIVGGGDRIDLLNMVVGTTVTWSFSQITFAYGRTIGGSSDQEFADEFRVLYNWITPTRNPSRIR